MLWRNGPAAMAAAILLAFSAEGFAGGEWPDRPNKAWLESLERPDNDKNPYRDYKSRFCCSVADTVKTRFKVEPGTEKHPVSVRVRLPCRWPATPAEKNC